MNIISYILVIGGVFLILGGTIKALISKNIIDSLHFIGISDTVGLNLLIVYAILNKYLTVFEGITIMFILIVSGTVLTHVIARSILKIKKEK
ncbi:MAG: multicomponent Na+:H+ antiporter subunit [Kosmotogales bacterium]|nr:multicomponent Na+:H+ antiporter subunit [Kosmotogales bacterium]